MTKPEWRKYPHQWLPLATDLNQTEKFVWMTLNDHQGNKDKSWPSQETLAFEVGVSVPTIERTVRSLQTKGYLFKRRARLIGAHRNDYMVSHPTLDLPPLEAITGDGYEAITDEGSKPSLVMAYTSENSPMRTDSGSAPSLRSGKTQGKDPIIHSDDGWDGHLQRCRSTKTCYCDCPRHECDVFCVSASEAAAPRVTHIGDPEL